MATVITLRLYSATSLVANVVCDRLQYDPCQPRTFSPGKRVFKPARTFILQLPGFSPGENAQSFPINADVLRELDDYRTPRASPIRSHGSPSS